VSHYRDSTSEQARPGFDQATDRGVSRERSLLLSAFVERVGRERDDDESCNVQQVSTF